MKTNRIVILRFLFGILIATGWIPGSPAATLEGNWNLQTDVEGAVYSTVAIDGSGKVAFSASYPYEYADQPYIFDVDHVGTYQILADNQITYQGIGNGVARDTNGTVTVTLIVTGTGMISDDGNMVAGVWVNTEEYHTPAGTIMDEDGTPYTLTKEGYEPAEPEEELPGVWEIHIQGENIDWTGQVTLYANGSILGEYSTGLEGVAPVVMSGFYTYSETKQFEFSYTTQPVEIPVVGETSFTLSGSGTGNEENTQIAGTWSFTVAVSDRIDKTFTGTFVLTKIENARVGEWILFE